MLKPLHFKAHTRLLLTLILLFVQVRFELTFFSLNPELKVVAPWREWEIQGREDAIEYAKKHNVPVPVTKKSIYSRDRNLWHLSHEVKSYNIEVSYIFPIPIKVSCYLKLDICLIKREIYWKTLQMSQRKICT